MCIRDSPRLLGVVAQRFAQLGHEIWKVGVRDERVRPEQTVELVFRHRLRPLLDQRGEEREGFRRDVDWTAFPEDFARVRVEHAVAESKTHSRALPEEVWATRSAGPDDLSNRATPYRKPDVSH